MQISMINRRNHLSGLEHQFEKLTTEERLIQRKEKPGPVSKRTGHGGIRFYVGQAI